jgi:hypothetical protein
MLRQASKGQHRHRIGLKEQVTVALLTANAWESRRLLFFMAVVIGQTRGACKMQSF